jgi:SAM-dependent methyltransferase
MKGVKLMVKSVGWDWENADKSTWLKPTEDSYYLANKWKEKGYKHILDLGTGLGRHAIFFKQHGFDVSAIDISDYGIEHLKTWAASKNLAISLAKGDMLSLPYADKSFDCVFAYHVISHTDTNGLKKTISEIERVLKVNREIFLSFISKESPDFTDTNTHKIDENTNACLEGPEIGIPHIYVDLDDILHLLANFNIEKIRNTQYCRLNGDNDKAGRHYYVNATLK